MIPSVRVTAFGDDALRASLLALGFESVDERPDVVVIDVRDRAVLARAASCRVTAPRVLIAGPAEQELCVAIGADLARVVDSLEPAVLGPAVMSAVPLRPRAATRAVLVSASRGGLGRTLFAVNVAIRLSATLRTSLVDVTGTGAAAWWLGAQAQPWTAIAGLVDELTADQLAVLAEEVRPGLRVIGGASRAPEAPLATAVLRAARALDDLVIVDGPLASGALFDELRACTDRTLLFAYDDLCSLGALALVPADETVWVIASQSRAERLGAHRAFRSVPRDDAAVSAALASRAVVRGQLGRAYDEIAELLRIDAT